MLDPSKIVTWFDENFQLVRRSRRKTLASVVGGAMKMQGTGVLACPGPCHGGGDIGKTLY